LHDLQIGSILLIFSSFIENINEDDLKRIYDDMRDDVRSNAFSSLLLSLDRWPSDDFIVETLEGFKVKLRPGYNALNDYRVGYEDRERNFYLSWNSLLILETKKPDPNKENDKDFLMFSLPRALIIEMLAGELLYLNSLYSELLKEFENLEEHTREARERAREIYVRTSLTFDLGYIQVPLIRKVLEKIVETYGFKSTLDGIKSALSALDASTSAEATEKLNVIILIVGLLTVLTSLLTFPKYWWLIILLIILIVLLVGIPLSRFWEDFKEIYYLKKKRH
jgi:ABC-type multidrug transport system fused ATPase/permease subunit